MPQLTLGVWVELVQTAVQALSPQFTLVALHARSALPQATSQVPDVAQLMLA